ncbi:hypothetical protein BVG19_g456 [[Candida] boidinii]|nr:hypothetical protein BVG19_g456 [[Candida] boidinii]OWB50249.1 hypothetical protein B5S27_g1797 [[Candida] boidinii]
MSESKQSEIQLPEPFKGDPEYTANISIPEVLPHDKMYSIQIGDRLFRLSGASLSSDAPSFFTKYFQDKENETKILFLDRSPTVFDKIYSHLQGYSIDVKDESEFVYLISDATYFNLMKLRTHLLKGPIFVKIGCSSFVLPKEILLGKGNYPNFFSVTFDATLRDPFKNNEVKNAIRPPPVAPPFVSNRSSKLFQDIVDGLQGKTVEFENEKHREDVLRECRYYNFFGLEQKFVNHRIQVNPFSREEEIIINLKDVKKSGLLNTSTQVTNGVPEPQLVKYARPFVEEGVYRNLIVQIDSPEVSLLVNRKTKMLCATFTGITAKRIKTIFSKVSSDIMYTEVRSIDGRKIPKVTMLIQLFNSVAILNGTKINRKRWWRDLLEEKPKQLLEVQPPPPKCLDEKTKVFGPMGTEVESEEIIIPDIIEIKVMKSQWHVTVSGPSRIWMNAVLIDGILNEEYFRESTSFI